MPVAQTVEIAQLDRQAHVLTAALAKFFQVIFQGNIVYLIAQIIIIIDLELIAQIVIQLVKLVMV